MAQVDDFVGHWKYVYGDAHWKFHLEGSGLVVTHSSDGYNNQHYPGLHNHEVIVEGDGVRRYFWKADANTLMENMHGSEEEFEFKRV